MHTAKEVRAVADACRPPDIGEFKVLPNTKIRQMLLAYADLLEAMEEAVTRELSHHHHIRLLQQRAAEKARNRK